MIAPHFQEVIFSIRNQEHGQQLQKHKEFHELDLLLLC